MSYIQRLTRPVGYYAGNMDPGLNIAREKWIITRRKFKGLALNNSVMALPRIWIYRVKYEGQ
jgi:hypothetical protein